MDFSNAIVTEQRAEDLQERYPGVAELAMGAEAALSILDRIDLDTVSAQLHVEVAQTSGQRRKKAMKRLRVITSYSIHYTKLYEPGFDPDRRRTA